MYVWLCNIYMYIVSYHNILVYLYYISVLNSSNSICRAISKMKNYSNHYSSKVRFFFFKSELLIRNGYFVKCNEFEVVSQHKYFNSSETKLFHTILFMCIFVCVCVCVCVHGCISAGTIYYSLNTMRYRCELSKWRGHEMKKGSIMVQDRTKRGKRERAREKSR